MYYWRQLEPRKGQFNWSLVTGQMAPWIAAGRTVILRVSTSGQAGWQPPDSGHGTPGWVFHDGARSVRHDGATIPVYWSAAYLADYRAFVQAFGRRFDGNRGVAFVEAGIGMGGETLPDTIPGADRLAAWWHEGYRDDLWLSTVETLVAAYRSAFPTTAVYVMVDHTFLDRSSRYYVRLLEWLRRSSPSFGLQFNGLAANVRLPAGWGTGIAAEQEQSTSASGDRLCADLERGIALGARYLLVFRSDIDEASNSPCLRHIAALAASD